MMAEAAHAGVLPHLFWDYTYRELAAVFDARNLGIIRDRQLYLWAQYQGQSLARHKRLPNLRTLLRKLEPTRVMSTGEIRNAILNMARAMGAKITRRKKEEG